MQAIDSSRQPTADKVAIIGGCGHVGLPLGIALANAGALVALVDIAADRVAQVRAGRMPFLERGSDTELPKALANGRLVVTTSNESVREADIVIVTVGTPVDEFLDPSINEFDRAMLSTFENMRNGQLLVLRSTVFPGVTTRLSRLAEERSLQIDIAYCPERIAQGFALEELGTLPQIVGGVTPRAGDRAAELFASLGGRVIRVEPVEAELAKLFANAYRYINFAIANQFYMIAQKFGADFDRVHAATTADYPRMKSFAKAGFAGGPCLLKDTMQLAAFSHHSFGLGQAAMTINEGLPAVLVEACKRETPLADKTVGILGMAFKGNSDDSRSSLSYKLRKLLVLECRRVLCTDAYIDDPGFVPLEKVLAEADVLFVGACHDAYKALRPKQHVVDVFGFLPR